jgi:hypothetical protein
MMATLEDEHTDAATHDIPDALTSPQRQSPGPYLHDVYYVQDDGSLSPLDQGVEVKARGLAGRKEAITKATADLSADDPMRYGTFRVVKHGEMSDPIVREQVVEPRDKWS